MDDVTERFHQLGNGALPRAAQAVQLPLDSVALAGQFSREPLHLDAHHPADAAEHDERQDHSQQDSRHARHADSLNAQHHRRQDERQQNGERQGYKHGLADIKDQDDEHQSDKRPDVRKRRPPDLLSHTGNHPSNGVLPPSGDGAVRKW